MMERTTDVIATAGLGIAVWLPLIQSVSTWAAYALPILSSLWIMAQLSTWVMTRFLPWWKRIRQGKKS